MKPLIACLLLAVVLAGCVASPQSGAPASPAEPREPQSEAPAPELEASEPEPEASTPVEPQARSERWTGEIVVHAAGASWVMTDSRPLSLARDTTLRIRVEETGSLVRMGGLMVRVVNSTSSKVVLQGEGDAPLVVEGEVARGNYSVYVLGGDGVGVRRAYEATAEWWE